MSILKTLPAQANGHPAAKKEKTMARIRSMAALALITAISGVVTGCGSTQPSREVTGSIPDDYRTRHPITIAEVRHTMDVPVASGDRNLNVAVRDAIRGFAQDYASTSSATVQISVPQGGMNAGAARHARAEIRKVLMDAGLSSARMIDTTYPVAEANASHPVKLSYVAITALTNECGTWPKDLISNTEQNVNYENFGCATQKNLAAQIANPMDLVAPRAMTPIDAERRSEVIRIYREGR